MRYLRYFEVDADYHAFKDSDRFKSPNISIIEETSLCYFSPYIAPPANEIYGVIEITEDNVNMPINLLYEDDGNSVKIPFNSNKIKAMRINNQKVTPTSTYTFDTPGNYTVYFKLNELLSSSKSLFNTATLYTSINLSNLYAENITDMKSMFYGCTSLTSLDLNSNWNTNNVTNMSWMFYNCSSLISLDLSGLDTSNVTNMGDMFSDCNSLTSLDMSNWNLSNATKTSYMFNGCTGLTEIKTTNMVLPPHGTNDSAGLSYIREKFTQKDIQTWDTSKVISMEQILFNCAGLTSIDLSNWDTSKVTNMANAFTFCASLSSLDLTNWNTINVTNMSEMFGGCSNLSEIKMGGDVSKVANVNGMFNGVASIGTFYYNLAYDYSLIIPQLPSGWRAVPCKLVDGVLVPCANELSFTANITSNNEDFTFLPEDVISKIELMTINGEEITPTSGYTFSEPGEYEVYVKFSEKLNDCEQLFSTETYDTHKFINFNLENFDTSNVTNMSSMFYSCYSLTSLDLSDWNTSNVSDMYGMFSACYSLTSLDLSGWDTSNVTDMQEMFSNCYNLTEIKMGGDVSNVSNVNGMFGGYIASLGTLYYNSNYDYSRIIDALPTSWVAIPIGGGTPIPGGGNIYPDEGGEE